MSNVSNTLETLEFEVWRIQGHPAVDDLSCEEMNILQAIRNPKARLTFVQSRTAIRKIVKNYAIQPPVEYAIQTHASGKPFLVNNPHLHFSLSHSQGELAIAFSRFPVGFDMENQSRRGDFHALARRFFSPDEFADVEGERQAANLRFLELWTAKEAMLKLEGTGISGGLKRAILVDAAEGRLDGRRVFLHRLEWRGFLAKIASYEKPAAVRVRDLIFD
ncbi:MAG: 4'-phosphopantetheinyl transferase superfamily protein [bacterium]